MNKSLAVMFIVSWICLPGYDSRSSAEGLPMISTPGYSGESKINIKIIGGQTRFNQGDKIRCVGEIQVNRSVRDIHPHPVILSVRQNNISYNQAPGLFGAERTATSVPFRGEIELPSRPGKYQIVATWSLVTTQVEKPQPANRHQNSEAPVQQLKSLPINIVIERGGE